MDINEAYLPEVLVGDVQVPDTGIACQYVPRHHVGRNRRLLGGDVNSGHWVIGKKILVNDNESTSVDGETTGLSQIQASV